MKEPPITNVDGFKFKGGLNSFIFFNLFEFEYRKSRTIKGNTIFKLTWATKCSNIHMHPHIYSQDSLNFTLTLAILTSAALPHLKRGTTTVRHCHTWAVALPSLKWPLGARGYLYPFLSSPMALCLFFLTSARPKQSRSSLSLSLHCWPQAPKQIHWFPHQSLREKGPKLD